MKTPATLTPLTVLGLAFALIAGLTRPAFGRDAAKDYTRIGFEQLANFSFASPPIQPAGAPTAPLAPQVLNQIPDEIKKLDGKKVYLFGFVLPTKIENGLATEFLLMKSQMLCCYGMTPPTNAWVNVKCAKGIKVIQDVPLPVCGRLHVHDQWDNGWLASIYQLDGDGLWKADK